MVTNDPVGVGVAWTVACGSAACGSFNPPVSVGTLTPGGTKPYNASTTYTAPSGIPTGSLVTITATSLTDTTKSASQTVTITGPPPPPPPPVPISVSILPTNIYVQPSGPGRSASVTALVSNDPAGAGVDWTLTCGASNCGSISAHTGSGVAATFQNSSTVPTGGTVTITAKSTSDPTKSASATANIVSAAPIVVTMSPSSPLPGTLLTGSSATLTATRRAEHWKCRDQLDGNLRYGGCVRDVQSITGTYCEWQPDRLHRTGGSSVRSCYFHHCLLCGNNTIERSDCLNNHRRVAASAPLNIVYAICSGFSAKCNGGPCQRDGSQ